MRAQTFGQKLYVIHVRVHHIAPLKKREAQKVSKYGDLVQSKGGSFEPPVTGSSGSITTPAKKLLQVVCSSQDTTDPKLSRCYYDFWLAKTSFSLHKTTATETTVRSAKVNGRQYSGPLANSSFPDSVDIHFEVSG